MAAPVDALRPDGRRVPDEAGTGGFLLVEFHEAEACHHDYAKRNPTQGYIKFVSTPKVRKPEKYFPEKLKKVLKGA